VHPQTDSPACKRQQNACKTAASVEKRLHIHSSKCAEAAFLPAKAFLSKIGSAWIQCFSSPSGST
jgi:hypothetical protein